MLYLLYSKSKGSALSVIIQCNSTVYGWAIFQYYHLNAMLRCTIILGTAAILIIPQYCMSNIVALLNNLLEWLKNKIFKQGIGIAEKSLETRKDRWGGNVNPKSLF